MLPFGHLCASFISAGGQPKGHSDEGYDYSMSVPDTISTGTRMGRASFTRGSLATLDQLTPKFASRSVAVQRTTAVHRARHLSQRLVKGFTSRVAAELAYHVYPQHGRGTIQNLTQFYHPLVCSASDVPLRATAAGRNCARQLQASAAALHISRLRIHAAGLGGVPGGSSPCFPVFRRAFAC